MESIGRHPPVRLRQPPKTVPSLGKVTRKARRFKVKSKKEEPEKKIDEWMRENPPSKEETNFLVETLNGFERDVLLKYRKFVGSISSMDPKVAIRYVRGGFHVQMSEDFFARKKEKEEKLKRIYLKLMFIGEYKKVQKKSGVREPKTPAAWQPIEQEVNKEAAAFKEEQILPFMLALNRRKQVCDFLNKVERRIKTKKLKRSKVRHDWEYRSMVDHRRGRIRRVLRVRPGEWAAISDPSVSEARKDEMLRDASLRGREHIRAAKWENPVLVRRGRKSAQISVIHDPSEPEGIDPQLQEYVAGLIPRNLAGLKWEIGEKGKFRMTVPPIEKIRKTVAFHRFLAYAQRQKKDAILDGWKREVSAEIEASVRAGVRSYMEERQSSLVTDMDISQFTGLIADSIAQGLERYKWSELNGPDGQAFISKAVNDWRDTARTMVGDANRDNPFVQAWVLDDGPLATLFKSSFAEKSLKKKQTLDGLFKASVIQDRDVLSALESMARETGRSVQEKVDLYFARRNDPLLSTDA